MGRVNSRMLYTLADGKRIRLLVPNEVKCFIEQTNRQIQSQRRKDRRYNAEYSKSLIDIELLYSDNDLADFIYEEDRNKRLHDAINKLPVIQQRRLKMYYFEDFTYCQIAENEGVAYRAVTQAVERAKIKLKLLLSE